MYALDMLTSARSSFDHLVAVQSFENHVSLGVPFMR